MSCLTISTTHFSFLLASMSALNRPRKLYPCILAEDRLRVEEDGGGGVVDDIGGSLDLLVSEKALGFIYNHFNYKICFSFNFDKAGPLSSSGNIST